MIPTVHVTPAGDLVEHEETDECVCGPRVDIVNSSFPAEVFGVHFGDVQVTGLIVVHRSLDGREA